MLVNNIMTKKVVSCRPEESLDSAAKKMIKAGISGAPVVDKKGMVIGIITESDILRTIDVYIPKIRFVTDNLFSIVLTVMKSRDEFKDIRDQLIKAGKLSVRDAMSNKPICIEHGKSVMDAVKLMNKYHVNRLPVVKDGKLSGIVSRADIIRALK